MKVAVYLNFVLTIILIGLFSWFFFYQRPRDLSNKIAPVVADNETKYVDQCGDLCKKQIADSINSALSTTSATTKELVKTVTVTPAPTVKKSQTAYIPIAGPITTTSSDWYDAPGTDFYLDYNTDYGSKAYANWEAFLKVADGNGTVYARLYDVTNKIGVNGSEVSISNKGDLTQVISGGLSFWSGNNQYRVQLKSLNKFEVTFGSGRIKIIY
jgi:hypothetical protein